jgi:metallophosphoesterase (TIGR00282 family)
MQKVNKLAKKISLLFVGDVVGKPGLEILRQELKNIIEKYKANFVVVNGENVDDGKGLTEEQADEIFSLGAHIITTGNHIWENWKGRPLLANNDKVLRPLNYPSGNAGRGFKILNFDDFDIAVLQLQGRTYMQTIDCPFRSAENALKFISEKTKNIIVDFHADATSEKLSMGWYLDGRVSAVIGTHTHTQTADAQILPKGTAYISDVGMTGPYESVLGMRKDIAIKRYLLQTAHKYEMASNDVKIAGAFVEIDAETGQAFRIKPFIEPPFPQSIFDEL